MKGAIIGDIIGSVYEFDNIDTKDFPLFSREQAKHHGKEICQVSVPQALECIFESTDFEDCMRNCISIGGDSDTIAAISGGIAEAYYGIPEEIWAEAESRLTPDLREIIENYTVNKSAAE